MSIDRRRRGGFTLIEMIVFIVIVGVALAGVLTVFNITTKSSSDPIQPKQAMLVAESMLEEILLKPYCDPDSFVRAVPPASPACGVHVREATRDLYDDVLDYDGYGSSGVFSLDDLAHAVGGLENYNVAVSVVPASLTTTANSVGGLLITVTVAVGAGGPSYALTGYRFNYD